MDNRMKLLFGSAVFISLCLSASLYVKADCFKDDIINDCVYSVVCKRQINRFRYRSCLNVDYINVTLVLDRISSDNLHDNLFLQTSYTFDDSVRSVKAKNNDWEDISTDALRYYTKTVYVDLSQNNINNIEDNAFASLILMKYLNVSNNQIVTLNEFSLKLDSDQNNLEILDLSNNYLTQFNTVLNFKKLQELYLQNNRIKILSDLSFYNLHNLKRLIIRNNSISGINRTLSSLNKLEILDISGNCINILHEYEIGHLLSLVQLNVSHNYIQTIEQKCFQKHSNLEVLDLSYNDINSTFDSEIFANNQHLIYVDLYQNNLRDMSLTQLWFHNITYLNLEKNNLTGDVTSNSFKGLHNVSRFSITHQSVQAIRNNAFSGLENLKHLNLSYNCISVVENSSFINATALTIFDISHNKVGSLFFFQTFSSHLTEIYINNNNLQIIPDRVFDVQVNLEKLDISNNNIVSISQNAIPLNKLTFLNIKNNNYSGVVAERVFSPSKFFKSIDLSSSHIEILNNSALIDLPLVERVNLSHNCLNFVHPSNFKGVHNMLSLDMSFNILTDLTFDVPLENLQEIYLNNNKFSKIPDIFGNNSQLELLSISFNSIANIKDVVFEKINQLKVLDLSYNNLTDFNNKYTNSLRNLSKLVLVSNKIEKMVNITDFINLNVIDITNNAISYINVSDFGNLKWFEKLILKSNRIETITPGTFQHLNSLKILDLSFNYLTNLRFGSFRGLNKTRVINLSANKLTNVYAELFHECYDLESLFIDNNYITSINIDSMVTMAPQLKVLSIGGNLIECHEIIKMKKLVGILITSLHKVYHEDNVHGIKCGNNKNGNITETTTVKASNIEIKSESSDTSVLLSLFGILGGLLTVGFLIYYCTKRYVRRVNFNSISMRFRNSNDMTNSECYSEEMD